jgi:DNA-binding HxlR family transcriptional regulator
MAILKKSMCRSACPIANALDVLGDRWTLLILRDILLMNKHEYHEFARSPEKIATNILSNRLKKLTTTGLIARIPHKTNKLKKLYYATDIGKALLPTLIEVVIWGGTHRASPDMPRKHFNLVRNNPKVFISDILKRIKDWERINLT